MDSVQAGDLGTPALGYEAPLIVCLGSLTELTIGLGGSGTDSIEGDPLGAA
jgi:hypothetical protein